MTSFIKVIMPKPDELTNESYKTPSTKSKHLITAKTEVSATCKPSCLSSLKHCYVYKN